MNNIEKLRAIWEEAKERWDKLSEEEKQKIRNDKNLKEFKDRMNFESTGKLPNEEE